MNLRNAAKGNEALMDLTYNEWKRYILSVQAENRRFKCEATRSRAGTHVFDSLKEVLFQSAPNAATPQERHRLLSFACSLCSVSMARGDFQDTDAILSHAAWILERANLQGTRDDDPVPALIGPYALQNLYYHEVRHRRYKALIEARRRGYDDESMTNLGGVIAYVERFSESLVSNFATPLGTRVQDQPASAPFRDHDTYTFLMLDLHADLVRGYYKRGLRGCTSNPPGRSLSSDIAFFRRYLAVRKGSENWRYGHRDTLWRAELIDPDPNARSKRAHTVARHEPFLLEILACYSGQTCSAARMLAVWETYAAAMWRSQERKQAHLLCDMGRGVANEIGLRGVLANFDALSSIIRWEVEP